MEIDYLNFLFLQNNDNFIVICILALYSKYLFIFKLFKRGYMCYFSIIYFDFSFTYFFFLITD